MQLLADLAEKRNRVVPAQTLLNQSVEFVDHIKLPKLELPKFSGNLADWIEFRDSYESIIHSNTTISNTQKFHYLKSCLRGEAALILKSVIVSDEGYETAWKTICANYCNERLIIVEYFDKLYNLKQVDGYDT